MSQTKIVSFRIFISIVFLLCYSGCSDKKKEPTVSSIIHPESWIAEHKTGYLSFKNGCTNCHGTDCDGGNVNVSCFSTSFEGQACHERHPAGWSEPTSHGVSAKLSSDTTSYGFSHCQKCHGANFSGGVVNVSCLACHGTSAPHARAPWYDTANNIKHYRGLDKSNSTLSICYSCHANGKYSDKKPDTTIATGAALGCKNNTICHPN